MESQQNPLSSSSILLLKVSHLLRLVPITTTSITSSPLPISTTSFIPLNQTQKFTWIYKKNPENARIYKISNNKNLKNSSKEQTKIEKFQR
jgi:hypothetical protein